MDKTREKLIELFVQEHERCDNTLCNECEYSHDNDCGVNALVDYLISHGVTVQEWISVKDRLPEDNKEVLIYCGSYHELGWYESNNKSWRSDFLGCCTDDVTHWIPLPEPPKGE